jgi:hypothetical protein
MKQGAVLPQPIPIRGVYPFVHRLYQSTSTPVTMKIFPLTIAVLLMTMACQAQPATFPHPPQSPPPAVAAAPDPVNYLIRVEWKEPKSDPKFLEVLTTEGTFNLDTIQRNSVKINNSDIPITLKFSGSLSALNDDEGRLQLYLGRTVPYVTGTYGSGLGMSSSYAQLSVGLNSTFIVKFGKPEVIQTDENGQITVLVKRLKD